MGLDQTLLNQAITNRNPNQRGYNDIKRYPCLNCGKSYMRLTHLKRHQKFECGREPSTQCPYCFVRMKQRPHVYRHIRSCHAGMKVFAIDLNESNS